MVLYSVKAVFDDFMCKSGHALLTNCLERMSSGSRRHGSTFLCPVNILLKNQFIDGVHRIVSTTKIFIFLSQNLIYKSPIRTEKRIVPKSFKGLLTALHDLGFQLLAR